MGFPSCNILDPNHVVDNVLNGVLGGGMSSPLFTEVREKRGLVYSVRSMTDQGSDYGNLAVYAGTTPNNLKEFFDVTCGELLKLTQNINEEDLFRTKNQLKSRLLMKMDKPLYVAIDIIEDLFTFGKVQSLVDKVRQIENVSVTDLKIAASNIFNSTPTLSLVGNIDRDDYYQYVSTLLR